MRPVRRWMLPVLAALVLWSGAAQGQSPALVEAHDRFLDLYTQGRYQEALPYAEEALSLSEREFGLDHPDVAVRLNALAEVYRAQGDYAKAEPLHKRGWPSESAPWALAILTWPRASTISPRCTRPRIDTTRRRRFLTVKRLSILTPDRRVKLGAYILNLTGGNPALASVGTNVTQRPMTGKTTLRRPHCN